jgi:tetratricopeptide (TPR) repeat protein
MPNSSQVKNRFRRLIAVVAALASLSATVGIAQQAPLPPPSGAAIQGTVDDAAGKPVADASVAIEQKDHTGALETRTNRSGVFVFSNLGPGTYHLSSEKFGLHSRPIGDLVLAAQDQKHVALVLDPLNDASAQAMPFADKPNFTVAGVTDWTAAGGHGSDAGLRTSEDLTREAIVLKPANSAHNDSDLRSSPNVPSEAEKTLRAAATSEPGSFEANHRLGEFYLRTSRYSDAVPPLETADRIDPTNGGNEYDLALACQGIGDFAKARDHVQQLLAHEQNADLHRLLGALDEESGDSLSAVREDEIAVRLDPSEQNYFQWGSELLLHRAVQPATEVFSNGAKAHPKSARMLAALGAALFAGGHDDEAALRLCDASDLNPSDPAPYVFLGKIEMAAPSPLICAEPRLARFVQQQPGNALANYYYAMAIRKGQQWSENSGGFQQVEALLTKAVTIDPKFDDAYLQLGLLYSTKHDFEKAAGFYAKAIAIDPQLSDAHYQLGVAYARIGEPAKSRQEFQLYAQLKQQQAAEVERQRREIKQFLIVLNTPATLPATN